MKYIFDIPDNVDYGVLTCRTSNGYYEYDFDGADLEKLPPAPPERIKGRWIPSDTDGFVCSVCRNGYRNQPTLMGKPMFEFCPVCGADMREVTT